MFLLRSEKREKTLPGGIDKADGAPRSFDGAAPGDRRTSDIIEQIREFKEAIKPKTPATNGTSFLQSSYSRQIHFHLILFIYFTNRTSRNLYYNG